jgi:SprT protein
MDKYAEILSKYIPPKAIEPVITLIVKHNVRLVITRHRKTKLGDFRPGINGKTSKITINHNLNKYAFLLTFLHELAHQLVWEKYRRKAAPHGEEWKNTFQDLRQPFLSLDYFPQEILDHLKREDKKIFAASSADTALMRTLKRFDTNSAGQLLETLPEKSCFELPDGRKFQKLGRRRKNYLCYCLSNKRNYIFNPLAEVYPITLVGE